MRLIILLIALLVLMVFSPSSFARLLRIFRPLLTVLGIFLPEIIGAFCGLRILAYLRHHDPSGSFARYPLFFVPLVIIIGAYIGRRLLNVFFLWRW